MRDASRRGFTLMELLVVAGVVVLVLSFMVPAVTGLTKGNNLSSGGRLISNLLAVARSEAINRRALIRFEVATDWPNDPTAAYRKVTLVQHDASSGTDTQLTNWEALPTGVVFQPNDPNPGNGSYLFTLKQTQTPPLTVSSQKVTSLYIEFLPTGALNIPPANSPVRFRLVPGYPTSTSAVTTTSSTNWYDFSADAIIGRIKTSRP